MVSRSVRPVVVGASAAAVALSLASASGCTSFGEAAAPTEAGTGDVDAGGATTEGGDASVGGALCAPPTCDDFELETWQERWQPQGGNSLNVTAGPSTSGTRSLDLQLDQNAPSFLVRKLGPVDKVTASMNMLVVERGDGEVDFFSVADATGPVARGIYFVHASATKRFSAEVSAASSMSVTATSEQSLATYTRIVIEVDLRNQRYSLTVGTQAMSEKLDPLWKPKQLFVSVGAPFVQGVVSPWRVRFDDVSVITVP